jgi:F0F1-type ATP synthase membrane subunit b/b'
MIIETFNAIMRDVTGEPFVVIGEVIQFAILAAAVWLLAVGFGKRQGLLKGMLVKRKSEVDANLAVVLEAPERASTASIRAKELGEEARAAAASTDSSAKAEADELEKRVREEADREAERISLHVDEALASEEERMVAELRTRLVDTVAQATRSVLSGALSIPEQRRLIEAAVVAAMSVEEPAPSGSTADLATTHSLGGAAGEPLERT